jgi:hypothetical protein
MAFLITLLDSNDQPWDTYGTSISSGIEMALAIITSCIPGLKPLVDRTFPRLFASTKSRTRPTNPNDYEMGSGRQGTHTGFVTIGSRKGEHDDTDSTKAIKVDYDYSVRVDSVNDSH